MLLVAGHLQPNEDFKYMSNPRYKKDMFQPEKLCYAFGWRVRISFSLQVGDREDQFCKGTGRVIIARSVAVSTAVCVQNTVGLSDGIGIATGGRRERFRMRRNRSPVGCWQTLAETPEEKDVRILNIVDSECIALSSIFKMVSLFPVATTQESGSLCPRF